MATDALAFGLIGYPLGHSWSKRYFDKKFASSGMKNCSYNLYPCQSPDALPGIVNANPALRGLNVTIPHKQTVIAHLSKLSDTAREIGAVNTILIERQASGIVLTGHNTDAWGFEQSLHKHNISPEAPGEMALVLGTGGASNAVAWVLHQLGWKVSKVTRRPAQSHQEEHTANIHHMSNAASQHKSAWAASHGMLYYDQLNSDHIGGCRLIVNSTPLGMYPNVDNLPGIPYQFLNRSHILYDLIYNPEQTRFLEMGKSAGCTTIGGLDMLIMQAEKSWEIWMPAG